MRSGPAQRPPQIPSSISNKKKYTRRSYPLACRLEGAALGHRTAGPAYQARHAAAFEPRRSAAGPTCQAWRSAIGFPALPAKRGAQPPLSRGCPLPPYFVTWLMHPCCLAQPLLRAGPPPSRYLR
jgi:hypothetical protein